MKGVWQLLTSLFIANASVWRMREYMCIGGKGEVGVMQVTTVVV